MKKTFFRSISNTITYILMNLGINTVFILMAIKSLNRYGEYRFDFTWMITFSFVFFILIFNAHFLYIGLFSRVIITDKYIATRKTIKDDNKLKWKNVQDVKIIKEMNRGIKNEEKPVILIEGYDELTKEDAVMTMDYREALYDLIIDCVNNAREKKQKKMDKYFD